MGNVENPALPENPPSLADEAAALRLIIDGQRASYNSPNPPATLATPLPGYDASKGLRKALSLALEALDFYASKESWHHGSCYAQNDVIDGSDVFTEKGGHYVYGGKRAREACRKARDLVIYGSFATREALESMAGKR
jgi:hypothetical protein